MILIALLVAFGSFLIIFGTTFSQSAHDVSRSSIIENFTGDFIIYATKSKEKPSPFAFQTPLPNIPNVPEIEQYLKSLPEVSAFAPYAQNYAILQVDRDGQKIELPFIFYAVDPVGYHKVFDNARMTHGSFFDIAGNEPQSVSDPAHGIVISEFQNQQYKKNYGITLKVGDRMTVLGLTAGGVNAASTRVVGIFDPRYYRNVFNYINFLDIGTYSSLYNFTGVESLPASLDKSLNAASDNEAGIFALSGDNSLSSIDLNSLKSEALSGYTMIAVKLHDHTKSEAVMKMVETKSDLGIKVSGWREASGYFAQIAAGLQTFVYVATGLIFLIVAFIFMNTLIINITERTEEIGTMRAIGAERGFIRRLFISETLILNLTATAVAMAAAFIAILAIGKGGIPLPDTFSQFLIGGGNLPLELRFGPFLQAIAVTVFVSILATLYPVRVATSITPLEAMNRR
jgi:putative ABC transport system permease protein